MNTHLFNKKIVGNVPGSPKEDGERGPGSPKEDGKVVWGSGSPKDGEWGPGTPKDGERRPGSPK